VCVCVCVWCVCVCVCVCVCYVSCLSDHFILSIRARWLNT
jgi:hypothetical protein